MTTQFLWPTMTHWAGAIAGLRVVVAGQATVLICVYRIKLLSMVQHGLATTDGVKLGAALACLSGGVLLTGLYGLFLIVTTGHVPADAFLFSRVAVASAYALFNLGNTILIAGFTARASGHVEGVRAFKRMALITVVMMVAGAWL